MMTVQEAFQQRMTTQFDNLTQAIFGRERERAASQVYVGANGGEASHVQSDVRGKGVTRTYNAASHRSRLSHSRDSGRA